MHSAVNGHATHSLAKVLLLWCLGSPTSKGSQEVAPGSLWLLTLLGSSLQWTAKLPCCSCMLLLLLSHFSRVWLCVTPETAAHQAPPSLDSPGDSTGVGRHCLLQLQLYRTPLSSLTLLSLFFFFLHIVGCPGSLLQHPGFLAVVHGPQRMRAQLPHMSLVAMCMWDIGLPGRCSGQEAICQCRRCKRRGFDSWVWKIPWSRKLQPALVLLPGKFHGQRNLVSYSPGWAHTRGILVPQPGIEPMSPVLEGRFLTTDHWEVLQSHFLFRH